MDNKFSARLSELREKKGVTFPELSNETGISVRALKYYVSEEREPSLTALLSIAKFFEVSIDYLVGMSDDPEIK